MHNPNLPWLHRLAKFILIVVISNSCTSQETQRAHYYTFASAKTIRELEITKDSLIIHKSKQNTPLGAVAYAIAEIQQKDNSTIYFLKQGSTRFSKKEVYRLAITRATANGLELQVVLEDEKQFTNLQEAKQYADSFHFDSKYHFTWFSKAAFDSITRYPGIEAIDSTLATIIFKTYSDTLLAQTERIRATHTFDMYGTASAQDALNGILISHHISPVSIGELGEKVNAYHIVIPAGIKQLRDSLIHAITSHHTFKDYTTEKSYINRILVIDSLDNTALYMKAQILAKEGHPDSAIIVLTRKIKADKDSPIRFLMFRAALLDDAHNVVAAAADYEALKTKFQQLADSTKNERGKIFMLQSRYWIDLATGANKETTISRFERAIEEKGITTKGNKDYELAKYELGRFNKDAFLASYRRGQI